MPANIPFLPKIISDYINGINELRLSPARKTLAKATRAINKTMTAMPGAENQHISFMEISAGQAKFLTILVKMLAMQHPGKPLYAIDIGTFTGASAGAMAKGMGKKGGEVITCDITDEYQAIAQNYWKTEGVADCIRHVIAPAHETLQQLLDNRKAGTFDIIFIDAEKTGYDKYYEKGLELLRPGGLILLDNMLWSGRVADPELHDPNTDALRDLNKKIAEDIRVDYTLLDSDDGIMVAMKRDPARFAKKAMQSQAPSENSIKIL